MSNRALTKTLTYGVITRIGSPLCAVYLRWWDDGHGRLGDGFPVWNYCRRIEVHEAGARRPAARAARVNRHVLSGVTG